MCIVLDSSSTQALKSRVTEVLLSCLYSVVSPWLTFKIYASTAGQNSISKDMHFTLSSTGIQR